MVASTNEIAKKLVNQELLIFQKYQVDVKNIECLLDRWKKHESMFPTIDFLAKQMLEIVSSQIEIERIFSLIDIFTNLKSVACNQITSRS
jgi:hypothetical protein